MKGFGKKRQFWKRIITKMVNILKDRYYNIFTTKSFRAFFNVICFRNWVLQFVSLYYVNLIRRHQLRDSQARPLSKSSH